jgi:hypothetical protein
LLFRGDDGNRTHGEGFADQLVRPRCWSRSKPKSTIRGYIRRERQRQRRNLRDLLPDLRIIVTSARPEAADAFICKTDPPYEILNAIRRLNGKD